MTATWQRPQIAVPSTQGAMLQILNSDLPDPEPGLNAIAYIYIKGEDTPVLPVEATRWTPSDNPSGSLLSPRRVGWPASPQCSQPASRHHPRPLHLLAAPDARQAQPQDWPAHAKRPFCHNRCRCIGLLLPRVQGVRGSVESNKIIWPHLKAAFGLASRTRVYLLTRLSPKLPHSHSPAHALVSPCLRLWPVMASNPLLTHQCPCGASRQTRCKSPSWEP
jgi:hypothetical protein